MIDSVEDALERSDSALQQLEKLNGHECEVQVGAVVAFAQEASIAQEQTREDQERWKKKPRWRRRRRR